VTSAPFFSVIIPTHNRAELLDVCLSSVFAQQRTDYEVIVVDDGSTDRTADVLAGYGSRVRVLHQDNRGPGAARNTGVRAASGQYLAFLDSDDVWFPWTLDTYRRVIEEASLPAFVAGKPRLFTDNATLSVTSASLRVQVFRDYYASSDDWRWYGTSSFVARADAIAAVGGFTDEWINCEDADLAMKLGTSPGFVHLCDPVTFGFREHPGTATGNLDRTIAGAWHAIRAEQGGRYPGGRQRATERRRILTRLLRPVMIEGLRCNRRADAWQMYRATFGWHLRDGRLRFLAGFPLMAKRSPS
jgi:hypothetical protein